MRISQHIAQQTDSVESAMLAAAEAGADLGKMEHLVGMLKTTLEALEATTPSAFGVLSTGYLSAFADTDSEWDHRIYRAKLALQAIRHLIGSFNHTLETVMDEFNSMRQANPMGARLFGFALCRLHPATTRLAEEAA